MRTTVEFDPDTAKAVATLRDQGMGASEAVNELIRRGMLAEPSRRPFVARKRSLGLSVDVSNVAEALDHLDGPRAR